MAFIVPYIATELGASATTAATLGTVAAVAGTGLSVLGAISGARGAQAEGKANAASARYAAQVAENNAKIAQQNSALAGQQGNAATEQAQLQTRAKVAAITADQAASGIDVNKGSAPDVRSSAAETGQLSAINIRAAAARQAHGYQQEAQNDMSQAALDRAEASNAITAGNLKAQTTLLGGLGEAGANYSDYLMKNSALPSGGGADIDMGDYLSWGGVG